MGEDFVIFWLMEEGGEDHLNPPLMENSLVSKSSKPVRILDSFTQNFPTKALSFEFIFCFTFKQTSRISFEFSMFFKIQKKSFASICRHEW